LLRPVSAIQRTRSESAPRVASESELRSLIRGLGGIDAVGVEARAAKLATRSLKKSTKVAAIDLAISMVDLTTLEGADSPGRVRSLCTKAMYPDSSDAATPRVAAVCVYPDLVAHARFVLGSSPVAVASVATAFPSGRSSLRVKLLDVTEAVAAGADEIDMVIDRGAFLSGRWGQVFDEIVTVKAACGSAHLKVILETGELTTYDNVRAASWLAMLAGADFIKTSTGKVSVNATLPTALVMLEAVRDFNELGGRLVGVKVAGGIRTTKDALKYLVVVNETAGSAWLTPDAFRFGASSLLNDLLMQRRKQRTGAYVRPDEFSGD
jgi:deoxyribose-phosphate aldolase